MKEKLLLPLVIIGIAVLLRLVPHLPNFAPITAMALFGGMYLDKKYAFILPLVALFLSDLFLGFHTTMPFVYVSFILSGLLGMWAGKQKTAGRLVIATLSASGMFFFITNFGVWLTSGMYQKSFQGLVETFVMALPFFRNTLFGDLLYTAAFVITYQIVLSKLRQSAFAPAQKK